MTLHRLTINIMQHNQAALLHTEQQFKAQTEIQPTSKHQIFPRFSQKTHVSPSWPCMFVQGQQAQTEYLSVCHVHPRVARGHTLVKDLVATLYQQVAAVLFFSVTSLFVGIQDD